jgi:hypothetical protein
MSETGTPQRQAETEMRVLRRVAEMLRMGVCRDHSERDEGTRVAFEPSSDTPAGLQRVECSLADGRIEVTAEMGRSGTSPRMPVDAAWNLLAGLPEGTIVDNVETANGISSRRVRIPILAHLPVTPLREVRIREVFEELNRRARLLAQWSSAEHTPTLPKALASLSERLEPALAIEPASPAEKAFVDCALRSMGAGPSTLSGRDLVTAEYAVALLASALPGPMVKPAGGEMTRKDLFEMGVVVSQHRGVLAVPVLSLSASVPPYEMGRVMSQLLRDLAARQIPALFYGIANDVGSVFAPQGVEADPLLPLAFQCPPVALANLVEFSARQCAASLGLSVQERVAVGRMALAALALLSPPEAVRIAGAAVRSVGQLALRGELDETAVGVRVQALAEREEVVGGGRSQPPRPRSGGLHARLLDGLASGTLLAEHKQLIIGQDQALEQLYRQLEAQLRFGAPVKPLAVLMEGPPGVGKSASVEFLARKLDMEMMYIDAASFGSHMQAHSLLLGSGLGIVNSYVPGKFEVASREHTALEIADLDHAPNEVRGSVVELFLQLMDRGTIQTGTGRTLTSSNMLVCFTCNLPEGDDFKMRRKTGFAPDELTDDEVRERIEARLSSLFSGAFLSRVGAPVVFSPLSEAAQREIIRRLLLAAVRRALPPGAAPAEVAVQSSAVDAVHRRCLQGGQSFGVRRLAALAHQALLPALAGWTDSATTDAHWLLTGRKGVLTLRRK